MAIELGKYLVYGELFNTRRNSTHGWLGLLGMECQILLQLTGNCDPDLDFDEHSIARFQTRQVGPTAKMTAALKVRVDASGNPLPPCLDDQEAGQWKDCLHMEWFGQNGRVTVVLVDPVIQIVGPAEKDGADAFFGDVVPDWSEVPADSDFFPDPAENDAGLPDGLDDAAFTPVPMDLQRDLDRRAADADRAALGDDRVSEDIREMELMDDLIEHGVGVPLQSIIDGTGPLPAPEALNENQAEAALKILLARLAVCGIAVDMCEHFTALDTYRLVREKMGSEGGCFPELRGTGWVQHYSTWEYCKACEAEFEREWEKSHPPGQAEGNPAPGPG